MDCVWLLDHRLRATAFQRHSTGCEPQDAMLFAVRRAELLTSQIAVVSRIQNRQWHSPGYFQARQKTPFELKRRAERRKLDGRRLEDSREHVLDGKRLVKASKAREYAKKALNLDPLTYVIGAVMTFGLIYIWFGYVRPWFKSSKRKVVLSLEESEVVLEEDLDVDKTKLPRPLLIVGESSPEKTALISCLLNGRESYFGWPVMHTTRKVRAREEETISKYTCGFTLHKCDPGNLLRMPGKYPTFSTSARKAHIHVQSKSVIMSRHGDRKFCS